MGGVLPFVFQRWRSWFPHLTLMAGAR
ncbi:hypothetical protein SMALA_1980 [Streptomyces malaysiensis subsp. malaysiensis]|nr:hypothetical protein SMALA_1980 [Streptomyces malaysiensis]